MWRGGAAGRARRDGTGSEHPVGPQDQQDSHSCPAPAPAPQREGAAGTREALAEERPDPELGVPGMSEPQRAGSAHGHRCGGIGKEGHHLSWQSQPPSTTPADAIANIQTVERAGLGDMETALESEAKTLKTNGPTSETEKPQQVTRPRDAETSPDLECTGDGNSPWGHSRRGRQQRRSHACPRGRAEKRKHGNT